MGFKVHMSSYITYLYNMFMKIFLEGFIDVVIMNIL